MSDKYTQQHMDDGRERAAIRHERHPGTLAENTRVNDQHIRWGSRLGATKDDCPYVGEYGSKGKK